MNAEVTGALILLVVDADEYLIELSQIGAANSTRAGWLITPDGYLVVGVSAG